MSVLAVTARRAVLADAIPGALAKNIALVMSGAVLTGLAAQIAVPIPGSPVPVTGQTFAALLVGAALGWKRGGLSLALYFVAGLAGVPWFTGGAAGWAAVTGGYLVGFIAASALVGALARVGGDRTPLRTVGTMALGNLVIYAVGVPWLMAATGMDLRAALLAGVVPFLVGDALKIALAAGLLPGTWALVRRFQQS
jgi:biotin transport system substrate-specific component